MASYEDRMYDLRDQVRIADIEARHDYDHDEQPDDECERCQDSIRDRAQYYRPSRAERQAAEYVTAVDGWVTAWEEVGV